MACRNTADEYGLSSFVILIIFCNLSAASRFGRANEFTAKLADGILLTVMRQAGSVGGNWNSKTSPNI